MKSFFCQTWLLTQLAMPVVTAVCCPPTSLYANANVPAPIRVTIQKKGDKFVLYRGGKPYFIRGAGDGGAGFDRAAACGANSIRTWETDQAGPLLDEAHRLGLTVTLGLQVRSERRGFDYNDTAKVAQQLAEIRAQVRTYKNHPAVLLWGIGNEYNHKYTNPKVWDAVNAIARMIHEEDPNHLATTVVAGINARDINYLKTRCPAIDLLSVNQYGNLPGLPQQIREYGWDKAYLVTEWGPTGWWETTYTAWKAPLEETSHEKALVYQSRYEQTIGQDRDKCVGSYVFLWGAKHERTPTWFGLFEPTGEATEMVDVMQYLWTGHWPANRAPQLDSLRLDARRATDNIYLRAGTSYPARVYVQDADGDQLTYRWALLRESTAREEAGDAEKPVEVLTGHLAQETTGQPTLTTPGAGAYRLFVYAYDGKNHVATANIPFYVQN